mgnify:CR=1 FL=1
MFDLTQTTLEAYIYASDQKAKVAGVGVIKRKPVYTILNLLTILEVWRDRIALMQALKLPGMNIKS